MTENPILECRDLSHEYGAGTGRRVVLREVNCRLGPGRMVALMGPSGSGKSTLLNIVGGLEKPTAGSVLVDGVELDTASPGELTAFRAASVGFVFQEWNLIRDLTLLENVMLPLQVRGVKKRTALARGREMLETVGIGDLAGAFPDTCSGGEQQRAAIARAVVDDRPLLLADEPTGALDGANGRLIIDLLRDCVRDRRRSCLIATHDPVVADACDAVWRVDDGQLTTPDGAPETTHR